MHFRRGKLAFLVLVAACASRPTAFERATALAREHRETDAVTILRDDLSRHPDDTRNRRLLIRVLALTGDLGAASREVETLSRQLGEHDPLPFIELGHAYEIGHEYEKALEMYDHAAEIAPADPRGPREGGMRAARWGEAEWARPRLEEAIRRGANDVETWHAVGLLRVHDRDFEQAEKAYRAGLAVDPNALECHLGLATIAVEQADGATALAEYDIILAKRPGWAPGFLGRAWALGRLGRKQEARAALAQAEKLGGEAAAVAAQRRALDEGP